MSAEIESNKHPGPFNIGNKIRNICMYSFIPYYPRLKEIASTAGRRDFHLSP